LPTAPRDRPARVNPDAAQGGDGHFIKGHQALAPVRHIRPMRDQWPVGAYQLKRADQVDRAT